VKTPRACRCAICNTDLTAKPTVVQSLGHATRALRAPPRARLTYEVGGGSAQGVKRVYVELWLCEAHSYPGDALGVLGLLLAEVEKKTK
jgi:hypothetical protein